MEYRVRFLPNWRPEHLPTWVDITDRLTGSTPKITKGIQRRESPFSLVYGDLGLTLNNTDRRFDDLLSLDKIMGTDPTDYRAPLIHYGKILIARREYGNTNWQPLLYFVEPKSVKFAPEIGHVAINCYSPGKLLEVGNAERVHRFSAIVGPQPWVLVGYDLLYPSAPPAGGDPDPAWWRIDGGASLPMLAGDHFNAAGWMAAVTEGQDVIDVGGAEMIVTQTVVDGADLLVEAYDANGGTLSGISLTAGQAVMQHLNPWWHNRRLSDLVDLLVGEVNDALAAANYDDVLDVIQDAFDGTLGASALDLIDGTGLPSPATGAGWFKDGTDRALAIGGDQGYIKADILLDPASIDRSLPAWSVNTAPNIASGTQGVSPDYGHPMTYPNPGQSLPGSPPAELDKAPITGQSRHRVVNTAGIGGGEVSVMSTYWHVTPPSLASAVGATKYAYRIEHAQTSYLTFPAGVETSIHAQREKIALYTTTDEGQTWTLSGSISTINNGAFTQGAQMIQYEDDTGVNDIYWEPAAQPWMSVYDVGGGDFLYLIFWPQERKAYWRKNNSASIAVTNLVPGASGLAEVGSGLHPGFRTGAITDGTDIFLFLDSTEPYISNVVTPATTGDIDAFYWNGTTMAALTLVDFPPNLSGADFQGALFDNTGGSGSPTRPDKLYIFANGGFYAIEYTYSAGTLTADSYVFVPVDTPSYNPALDMSAFIDSPSYPVLVDRQARPAWLCGPVDVSQGGGSVVYPDSLDALLVITETAPYIYSSNFGGVIRIADFSGLSSSTAIEKLIQIPQFVQDSGCDLDTITDPDAYDPTPTVRLTKRIVTSGTPLDVIDLTLSARSELWICQYTDVRVQNSAGEQVPEVRNDLSFTLDGQQYTVIAARYGGVNSLKIDNPFISTRSLAKLMANGYAYEFLIPRFSGPVKIIDPFAITDGTTIVAPQSRVEYLKRAPDGFTGPETAVGKVIKISYSLDDNTLDIEVA